MSAVIIRGRFERAARFAPPSPKARRSSLGRMARNLASLLHFPTSGLYTAQHAAAALQIEYLHPRRKEPQL